MASRNPLNKHCHQATFEQNGEKREGTPCLTKRDTDNSSFLGKGSLPEAVRGHKQLARDLTTTTQSFARSDFEDRSPQPQPSA